MPILLDSLKQIAAKSLLKSIVTKADRYYFYFGQSQPFATNAADEDSTLMYEADTRSNIYALKEIYPSDVSFVVPRIDYTAGVTYSQYNTLTSEGDYVYNTANQSVYVCVLAGVGVSTVAPTQTSLEVIALADGYAWRYIYTIPLAMRDRFLTSNWIPVSNVLNESFFSNGGIDGVSIVDSGDGYQANSTSITVTGERGIGHGASLYPVIVDGKITSVIVNNAGYGYIAPTISITSPTATRVAKISPIISSSDIRSTQAIIQTLATPGTIESVSVLTQGTGYTSNVTLSVEGDGTGATVSFVRNVSTGAISSVTITSKGSGYTVARLVINDTPLIGGSGFTSHLNISPILGFGRDAVKDLKSTTLMVYQNLSREKLSDVYLDNNIRQYGIIQGPKSIDTDSYLRDRVSEDNYISTISSSVSSEFPVGTVVYNEFPVTANTQSFIVDEFISNGDNYGVRLRATNSNWKITSGSRYYKNAIVFFTADFVAYGLSINNQLVSACYTLGANLPNTFNTNIFTTDTVLTKAGKRFVILAVTSNTILVNSLDGATITVGDSLVDGASNTLTPDTVIEPIFDKKSGTILTIDKVEPFKQSQVQSISFRTIITF